MTISDYSDSPKLIAYMRLASFLRVSIARWGETCCWLQRTIIKLNEAESDAINEMEEEWFDGDRANLLVVNRMLFTTSSNIRYAIMVANTRLCGTSAVTQSRTDEAKKRARDRWAEDPSQRAKNLAEELWPEANRHGWTADKLHQEITKRGEYASSGRVAKWLTNLRKTGRC